MSSCVELRDQWDRCLQSYDAEKSDVEAGIAAIRESMHGERGPLPDGFLSRLKSHVGRGVEAVKTRKQIWNLERQLSASRSNVTATAARTRDQLLSVALDLNINSDAKAELGRLPASSKVLVELRNAVKDVLGKLEKAAGAQDFAYNVQDQASRLQAMTAASDAASSLEKLKVRLMRPPPELDRDAWGSLDVAGFSGLNLHTFAANRAGEGRWMNTEMAKAIRAAINKVQEVDRHIAAALESIAARKTSLSSKALAAACAADPEIGKLSESVKNWLGN